MTITELPGEIATSTRDREIEKFKRSFRLRIKNANTGDGTQVDIDARICADILMPLYAAAKTNGDNSVMENARGNALKQWGRREGVGDPLEAQGASGLVKIDASPGGGTILAGEELKHKTNGKRYRVITTDHYDNGDPCAIVAKDTGPGTNLDAGTQLVWTSPPPGIGDAVVVLADASGRGLTGGTDAETEEDYLARIQQEKQNRAASGNDAQYQLTAEATPNAGVQKSFTYAAVTGTLTTCVVCTVKPAHPGGSRAPSAAQVSLIEAHVAGEMPADDGASHGMIVDQPTDVVYAFDWAEGALGWEDAVQWPQFFATSPSSGPAAVVVSSVASATVFTLRTANNIYTGIRQPVAGQTLGFYDRVNFAFIRKRILSFTGTGPWVVTCDTSNNVSDTSFTPEVGQRAMPWSESLNSPGVLYAEGQAADGTREAVPASGLLAYFDTLGPGEQVSSFYDEGMRQRRNPRPPKAWPFATTRRGLIEAITSVDVEDVDVLEGEDAAPDVGTPGILSNLLLLRWVAVFPAS